MSQPSINMAFRYRKLSRDSTLKFNGIKWMCMSTKYCMMHVFEFSLEFEVFNQTYDFLSYLSWPCRATNDLSNISAEHAQFHRILSEWRQGIYHCTIIMLTTASLFDGNQTISCMLSRKIKKKCRLVGQNTTAKTCAFGGEHDCHTIPSNGWLHQELNTAALVANTKPLHLLLLLLPLLPRESSSQFWQKCSFVDVDDVEDNTTSTLSPITHFCAH